MFTIYNKKKVRELIKINFIPKTLLGLEISVLVCNALWILPHELSCILLFCEMQISMSHVSSDVKIDVRIVHFFCNTHYF